jgi:dihydroneopterin aldolase
MVEILGIRTMGCHGRQLVDQRRPQRFEVDLRLDVDLACTPSASNLEDTVDYALLIEAVARTVELRTFPLLELLADRIAGICVSLTAVTSAKVTVRKTRPAINVQVGSVGVTVRRESSPARCGRAASQPADTVPAIAVGLLG